MKDFLFDPANLRNSIRLSPTNKNAGRMTSCPRPRHIYTVFSAPFYWRRREASPSFTFAWHIKGRKEDPKECATLAMKESSSFPPTMLLLTLLFIFRWVLISVFLLLSFVLRLQRSGAVLHILEFQGKRDQQKAGGVFYRVP